VITPPIWQTWWFRLLAVATVAVSIIYLYRLRVKVIKKQKISLEKQVRERTESLAQKTREERKARQEAYEANQELERKNKELEQFAYVASHDMQEPLRTISSFVELLQIQYQDNLDESAHKYMSFIVQASERMKILISDLLEYSRIGKKKELSIVDCNLLVSEVIADLGVAISEAGAEIEIGPLPILKAYPTEMKQILQNLISNALKFKKKNLPPHIKILAKRQNGYWQFSVSDNGIGIDPKHNERIFAIFQRLHTRSEYEGAGIGLANCKKIAELHGGKIWVESTAGEGSNFYFTIRNGVDKKEPSGYYDKIA
jgi:light-regulated signal transduction histidine kinase (bacteriophytochrome)